MTNKIDITKLTRLNQVQLAQEIRSSALKATPARVAILGLLKATLTPLDEVSIYRDLNNTLRPDQATVFRTLKTFIHQGLIRQVQLNEGKFRYEYVSRNHHHHFVCERCGQIKDINSCQLELVEQQLARSEGLLIKRHSLEFFGLCQKCQQPN